MATKKDVPRVIFDHDGGSDDLAALSVLLHQHNQGRLQLIAVSCVTGNTDLWNVVGNSRGMLTFFLDPRGPFKAPEIWIGSKCTLLNGYKSAPRWSGHGPTGTGPTFTGWVTERDTAKKDCDSLDPCMHSSILLISYLQTHPNHKIDLICTGPLTNLALACNVDSNLLQKLHSVWIMGGTNCFRGNVLGGLVEWNFGHDPESAKLVLNKALELECELENNNHNKDNNEHSKMKKLHLIPYDIIRNMDFNHVCDQLKKTIAINTDAVDYPSDDAYGLYQSLFKPLRFPTQDSLSIPDLSCVIAYLMGDTVIMKSEDRLYEVCVTGDDTRGMVLTSQEYWDFPHDYARNICVIQKMNTSIQSNMLVESIIDCLSVYDQYHRSVSSHSKL